MMKTEPNVLLLGCGYTLSCMAKLLVPGSFVATSRAESQCLRWREKGWLAEQFSIDIPEKIQEILKRYPSLTIIIDSIPPKTIGTEIFPEGYSVYLKHIAEHKLRVFYLSTTGVSGVDDGSVVNEDTPCSPKSSQAMTRFAVESLYHNACNSTAFRLPAIYGPGRGIGHSLKEGRYTLISNAQRWTNRIQVNDLAGILLRATACVDLPSVLYVGDDRPATQREVVDFYCTTFSLPFPREITLEEARRSLHHTQLSNQKIDNRNLKHLLGVKLSYPSYREGSVTEWQTEATT